MNSEFETKELTFFQQIYKAVKAVSPRYWDVVRVGSQKPAYRERVFCYELYHQLRLLQEKGEFYQNFYEINAEIDKRGDQNFKIPYNPDFVFHTQGIDEQNACAVEVKVRVNNVSGIQKDLLTLFDLVANHKYKEGIFLLINHDLDKLHHVFGRKSKDTLQAMENNFTNIKPSCLRSITISAIKNYNSEPEKETLEDFVKIISNC